MLISFNLVVPRVILEFRNFVFSSAIVAKSLGIGDLTLPFVLTNQYRSVILFGKRRGSVKINRCTTVAPQAVQLQIAGTEKDFSR